MNTINNMFSAWLLGLHPEVSHVAKILVAPPLPVASLMGRRLTRAPVGGTLSMLATHSAAQIPSNDSNNISENFTTPQFSSSMTKCIKVRLSKFPVACVFANSGGTEL